MNEIFDIVNENSNFQLDRVICDTLIYGFIILCLYVDDIDIMSSNENIIKSTNDMLNSKFHERLRSY